MNRMENPRILPTVPLPGRSFSQGEPAPATIELPPCAGLDWQTVAHWHGWDLLLLGFPWEAHEVWERIWRVRTGSARSWLQGLIRLAAALVKARSGNAAAVNHHVAGAFDHWRTIPPVELPHQGEILPLLEEWMKPGTSPPPQSVWVLAASGLKSGEPGPNLHPPGDGAVPGALVNALMVAFQRETAPSTAP